MHIRCILVLLVFRDQVLHVRLGFGELHLIHALLRVPMQEGLALEHERELFTDTPEEFLDGSRVTKESDRHLEATRRNITLCGEDIVGDPLDEIGRVLALNVLYLLLDFLHRDLTTEYGSNL